ncbi:hypothetical protein [Kitasatospora sp. NPDC094015]|uniref:hypothetical protein n=1 Tax=Kitasatospora sp. NPDC094015 TaxID=3155205 RepID=UPI0033235280
MIPRIVDVSIAGLFQNPPTCDAVFAVNAVNDSSDAIVPFMSRAAGYMLFAIPTCAFVVADATGDATAISAVARAPTANAFRIRRSVLRAAFGALHARLDLCCICCSSSIRVAAGVARAPGRWHRVNVRTATGTLPAGSGNRPNCPGICEAYGHDGTAHA